MSEYIPKYPSHEGDDSNKSSSELLAETLKPIYVPQELMLAWESHLAGYSRDTHVLLDQVKDSEAALNTQYQALLARVQKYEQMLQDITMDSNEFLMDSDEENFTGWNILAQASYWDYLLKKEITKLRDTINGVEYRGGLVSDISNEILEGLIADNNYISNVIGALAETPLIRELADALNTTTTSLSDLQAEYVSLAKKQAADAEALAHQQVEKAEQLVEAINDSIAEQLDRIAQEAAIRTQLLQELEDRVNDASAQAEADVAELHDQVDSIREGSAAVKADILETVNNYKTELKSDIATVNTELLGALDGVHTLVTEVRDENGVTLNELTTYKASNDVAVAGVLSKVTTNISDTAANASKITGLTAELATTNKDLGTVRNTSANALSKATTAVTANSALATRVDALAASITDLGEGAETSVDVYAFNALKAEVGTNAAGVSSLVEQVDALGANYTNLTDGVQANTDAVSTLTVKQSEMDGDISQISSDVTLLTSELGITNTALDTKASNQALSNLNTKLTTTDGKVAANTQQLTQLNTDLTTVKNGLETKASTEALNDLATEVIELEDGLAVNASAITSLKSEIDTELDKKATVTAVNGLTTKVEDVEGKTTTNANNLLALNTTVGNVVNGLANKLDASAISDYYTKSQTDDKAAEVAAGKVEEFSANLIVGGENLIPNSDLGYLGNLGLFWTGAKAAQFTTTMEDSWSVTTFEGATDIPGREFVQNKFITLPNAGAYTFSIEMDTDATEITSNVSFHTSAKGHQAAKANIISLGGTRYRVVGTRIMEAGERVRVVDLQNFSATGVTYIKFRYPKLEFGTVATAWTENSTDVLGRIKANSTAIQTTNAEVSRVGEQVTATNSAQTLLEGRVQTVEGGIAKKADASALSSLDTRVGTVEGQYTTQASDITKLTNSLDTTIVDVGTAQSAAQNAMNAAGAKGKVIFGGTAPAAADRLTQNLWIDTTGNANTPKRWNGSAWVVVTDKVATDAANAVKTLDTAVKTKADVSALNSLTTKVTDEAKKTTANTNSITELNSDIVKINNDIATKANASALSDMYTKNEVDDKASEIAAGEVSKYDASLVIGGQNLIPKSSYNFRVGTSTSSNTTLLLREILADGSLKITCTDAFGSGYIAGWQGESTTFTKVMQELRHGEDFTVTVWFKAVDIENLSTLAPTLYLAQELDYVRLVGDTSALATGREVPFSFTRKWRSEITTISPHFTFAKSLMGGGVIVTKWQLERGNKSTDWSESAQDTQEQLDANATAIQNTNAEVVKVDDKTIANANNIIKLNSDVTEVKNGLTTKANTSALQDYYTISQTDDVATTAAAGEIAKYDASLIIGGNNLLLNSNFSAASSSANWVSNGGGFTKVTDPIHGSVLQTNLPSGLVHAWLKLENGVEYTYSALIKPSAAITMRNSNPLHYHAGLNNVNQSKIQVLAKSHDEIPADKWTHIWIKFKLTSDADSFRPHIYGGGSLVIQLAWTQLEKGSKATDWSPNSVEIQQSLDANATAIENTNAEVKKVDGRVTTEANKITKLSGRIDDVEGDIKKKADAIAIELLTARVEKEEGHTTSQGDAITQLKNTLDHETDGLASRASSEALSSLNTLVEEIEGQVSTSAESLELLEIKVDNPLKASGSWKVSSPRKTATSASLRSLQIKEDKVLANRIDTLNASLGDSLAEITESFTAEVSVVDGRVSSHASQLLTLTSDNEVNKNALEVQAKVIDGVKASYMVKMETNGVIGGFGLLQSTGVLGEVKTSFGVNANSFFIGAPASKKQPFIVTTTNEVVDGVTYPAGTYIDVALIANATIGTAHISDASITNAKIKELDASKITTGTLDAGRIRVGSSTQFDSGFAPAEVLNSAKSYTDSVEVGAANLLYRSYDASLWRIFGSPTMSLSADNYVMENSMLVTQTTFEGSGGTSTLKVFRQLNNPEIGKTLTMSAYVKNRGTKDLTVNSAGLNIYSVLTVAPGKIERIILTGTVTSDFAQFKISTLSAADAFKVDIIDLKFEYGNKATSWTPSPAEVNALIDSKAKTFLTTPTVPYSAGDIWKDGTTTKVAILYRGTGSFTASDWVLVGDVTANNTAADTAKVNGVSAATVVSNAANGAAVYSDVMSDLKITPVEKTAINQEWNRIQKEYASLLAQAQALSLTTTTYTSAYTGLSTTAPAMSTILASMSTTTTLTAAQRDAYKTQYTTYYTQAVAITKAITDKIAANAKAQADAKAKTFTAQPVPPYTAGDLWKNGTTIRISTVTRATGSYVAADWTLVGDVTSANTAADASKLGGKASATVFSDITGAKNAADAAALKASSAENQLTLWKYPNTTYIDGGKIYANSITANQINVDKLSSITSSLGTIKVGTANIDKLAVDTLHIKDRAITVPLGIQTVITNAAFSGNVAAGWQRTITIDFPGIEVINPGSFCTLFFRSDLKFSSKAKPQPLRIEISMASVVIGVLHSRALFDGVVSERVYSGIDDWTGSLVIRSVTEGAYVDEQGSIQLAFTMPHGVVSSGAITVKFINAGAARSVVTSGTFANLYLVEFKK